MLATRQYEAINLNCAIRITIKRKRKGDCEEREEIKNHKQEKFYHYFKIYQN